MIDIRKLASEAKLGGVLSHDGGESRVWIEGADWHDELERFAALVLEEAAKECDEEHKRARFNMDVDVAKNREFWNGAAIFADQLGEAIRSLKPKGEA